MGSEMCIRDSIRIGLFSITGIMSLFFFPILLLFVVQLKNLCLNKTTFERFAKQPTAEESPSSIKNQMKPRKRKQRGPSLKNCKIMCSNTRDSMSSMNSLDEGLMSSGRQ